MELDISPEMRKLLDDLKIRTNAKSPADVIRRAVSIYRVLMDEHDAGHEVTVNNKNGKPVERVKLP